MSSLAAQDVSSAKPTEPVPADAASASDSSVLREEVLQRFEQAWNEGQTPRLEDHLPPGADERRLVLLELVLLDLEHRLRTSRPTSLEDYLERFRELAGKEALVRLVALDYEMRHRLLGPAPEDYLRRFPGFRQDLLGYFQSAPRGGPRLRQPTRCSWAHWLGKERQTQPGAAWASSSCWKPWARERSERSTRPTTWSWIAWSRSRCCGGAGQQARRNGNA